MSRTQFWISVQLLLCLLYTDKVKANYPELHSSFCARLKNVVAYQGEICIPDPNRPDEFTENSKKNCENDFKSTCPEFNEAECMWYELNIPGKGTIRVPTCRLKYYAKRYTWMEINYANQYGPWFTSVPGLTNYSPKPGNTSIPIYTVVEVHRMIKNHNAFQERDQGDFPESVQDSRGERGLAWVTIDKFREAPPNITGADICASTGGGIVTDTRCTTTILKYLEKYYPEGFEKRLPEPDAYEKGAVNITLSASCYRMLADGIKPTYACRVLYTRRAMDYTEQYNASSPTAYPFLEVQVYKKATGADHAWKYGYWCFEKKDVRDSMARDAPSLL